MVDMLVRAQGTAKQALRDHAMSATPLSINADQFRAGVRT
jgi:hypothetical protein